MRKAKLKRTTKETDIRLELSLDGTGEVEIDTGLGFLDHMLTHLAMHGLFDLLLTARGDLEVDEHHIVEDCALALGQAFDQALGDRKGITRMGSAFVPMDETLAQVVVDLSGRPYSVIQVQWNVPQVGGISTTLFTHFLESFAVTARCNLHARLLYGMDDHHKAEALFKGLGRALDQACLLDSRCGGQIPSTKGTL
jgi:imidazoleglycerol-phosphate dehydratase